MAEDFILLLELLDSSLDDGYLEPRPMTKNTEATTGTMSLISERSPLKNARTKAIKPTAV